MTNLNKIIKELDRREGNIWERKQPIPDEYSRRQPYKIDKHGKVIIDDIDYRGVDE